jgi:SAM-dependent methyltransferase
MHHASRLGDQIRSMSRDEFCAANRRNWDERVAIHRRDATGFYAVERFLAGEKRLHAIDSGELCEIAGKRLIHLQCHFGLDTLILAREGAIATGLDFSPAAIAEARRLAAEIGVAADFVCADVYDAPLAVEGEFDIVFTTWGDRSTHELRLAWRQLYCTGPPLGLSRDLLIRALANQLQERTHGGASGATATPTDPRGRVRERRRIVQSRRRGEDRHDLGASVARTHPQGAGLRGRIRM